jgi:hypothetical protein
MFRLEFQFFSKLRSGPFSYDYPIHKYGLATRGSSRSGAFLYCEHYEASCR